LYQTRNCFVHVATGALVGDRPQISAALTEVVVLPKSEKACFVIADVSGYTKFLVSSELEHAQDIIVDFMDTVVEALRPTFRLAKFEGDAAFLYAVGNNLDGSLLEDTIETAYFKFRRRKRDVRQSSACKCKACASMGDLDLKIVIHHGEMVKQSMGGREELAGRDVILVHRLLKNIVNERFGRHAYALYSDACIKAMDADPTARGLSEHSETIDIIGDVRAWYRDLEAAWQKEEERRHLIVERKDAYIIWDFDIPAPRQIVWEYATVPGQWLQWWFAENIVEESENGRRGIGTKNHCTHGGGTVIEEILDWNPIDYFTIGITLPNPNAPQIIMTRTVTEGPAGGSVLEMRVAKPEPEHKEFVDKAAEKFGANMVACIERFQNTVKDQPVSLAMIEEPSLRLNQARFLSKRTQSDSLE
jgi:uncharacterized protein YndB with AHSA1/START domain